MTGPKRISTREINAKGFAPHGSMELAVADRLNVIEATGPFNIQLVTAGDEAQEKLDSELQANGRWATLLVFRHSAMASFEVFAEIEKILKRRLAKGIRPQAVAIVLHPSVEGATLMAPFYLRAYANASLNARLFEDEQTARNWLMQLLGS
jgi:hypothetical protein